MLTATSNRGSVENRRMRHVVTGVLSPSSHSRELNQVFLIELLVGLVVRSYRGLCRRFYRRVAPLLLGHIKQVLGCQGVQLCLLLGHRLRDMLTALLMWCLQYCVQFERAWQRLIEQVLTLIPVRLLLP